MIDAVMDAIEVEKIGGVLLPDGKLHQVEPGSFHITNYIFHRKTPSERFSAGIKAAKWKEPGLQGGYYICPINSVLAVVCSDTD